MIPGDALDSDMADFSVQTYSTDVTTGPYDPLDPTPPSLYVSLTQNINDKYAKFQF